MSRRLCVSALAAACCLFGPSAVQTPGNAVAATTAAACSGADRPAAGAAVGDLTISVRCLINAQRAQAGLRPVGDSRRLARAARAHAADQVARHYFAHESLGGRTLVDRLRRSGYLRSRGGWAVGEIQAWASGTQATPRSIVGAWMASGEHRPILLGASYADVGVGVAIGSPQNGADRSAMTVVADFGAIGRR